MEPLWLFSINPKLISFIKLVMQMVRFTLGMQTNWFIISWFWLSRFWNDWKCYLLFLYIDIHVCHFHENLKETVLIFEMTTILVCSKNHMSWYHSYSLFPSVQTRLLLMKGAQNDFWGRVWLNLNKMNQNVLFRNKCLTVLAAL